MGKQTVFLDAGYAQVLAGEYVEETECSVIVRDNLCSNLEYPFAEEDQNHKITDREVR